MAPSKREPSRTPRFPLPDSYGVFGSPISLPDHLIFKSSSSPSKRTINTIEPPALSKSEIKCLVASHLMEKRITINPDQEIKYKVIDNTIAHIYCLRSFTETRTASWSCSPSNEETVDDATNGSIPDAWEIPIEPERMFESHSVTVPVPHSSFLESCPVCSGNGSVDCADCDATGLSDCHKCAQRNSNKRDSSRTCPDCGIKRQLICHTCYGCGEVNCLTCDGNRSLKYILTLQARFEVHSSSIFSNAGGLPVHLVTDDMTVKILEEAGDSVCPIQVNEFVDVEVVAASQKLHSEHAQTMGKEGRLLAQKQEISALPLTIVGFKCRGKKRRLHVFGRAEKTVHFNKYPPNWSHLVTFRHSLSP